jgi:hypothetical protein
MSWCHRIIHDTTDPGHETWYIAEYYTGMGGFTGPQRPQEYNDYDAPNALEQAVALTKMRWTIDKMLLAFDLPVIHWDGKTQREGDADDASR